ncbi:GNAT family N-acetyltransferase [Paeniglutamicibacter sp. R2-26]|uniref:GNAT family N-acetyltransferase n=1 Tax=Paeniglutamicibacter sp. R2-26 TaxID=3144417 RepID=UPI003EE5B9E0
MTEFANLVSEHWVAPFESGEPLHESDTYRIAVNNTLSHGKRVQILSRRHRTCVLVTETVSRLPGIRESESEDDLRKSLETAGLKLNGADFLFFLPDEAKQRLAAEAERDGVRRLTANDAEAFAEFEAAVPAADLDGAAVEIDHWMAYGAFRGDVLVAAGSSYPVADDVALADIGVVTHPGFRRQGHARSIVLALAQAAIEAGHEPQYRCQLDNHASRDLARRSGFSALGTWDVPLPDEEH